MLNSEGFNKNVNYGLTDIIGRYHYKNERLFFLPIALLPVTVAKWLQAFSKLDARFIHIKCQHAKLELTNISL
ncbi:hypothetical protein BCU12_20210 [Vibrio sp. 10N.261.55.A7]|nr:hypothetical protein BCU12_20210 [Vibrio sp. 10N.261.55.A7]